MLVKVGSGRLCRRCWRGGDRWLVTHNNNIFFVSLLLNGKYSTLTHCERYLIIVFFSVYLFFLILVITIIIMIIIRSRRRIRIRIIIDTIYTELFPKAQYSRTSRCDHLAWATTSYKWPPSQNTKNVLIQSLILEPLANDHIP